MVCEKPFAITTGECDAMIAATKGRKETVCMQAALLHDRFVLRVEEIDYPTLGEGEVIIKVHRASVCNGSDAALYSGRRKREVAYPWMKLPWVMGMNVQEKS